MKGGFLLGNPAQKPKPQKKAEDLTHIKAKPKEEQLKLSEVQEAMSSTLVKNKDEWLTPEFFTKLA